MSDAALIAFLRTHGLDELGHSDAGLLPHLLGTRDLLAAYGARPALQVGGLLHSVYGTESYRGTLLPLGLRDQVRALAGVEAEQIAYRFGAMEKQTVYDALSAAGPFPVRDRFTGETWPLDRAAYSDLCNLTVANWLEQRPRVAVQFKRIRSEEFSQMRPFLLPGAREAIELAYGM